jgi:hypothetical protein
VPSVPFRPASIELGLKNIFRQRLAGFAYADELPIRHRANALTEFRQIETRLDGHSSSSKTWVAGKTRQGVQTGE